MASLDLAHACRQVASARMAVATARTFPNLTPAQKERMDALYRLLCEVEDTLALPELGASAQRLHASSRELSKLAAQMRAATPELQDVAMLVAMAAGGLGAVVDAARQEPPPRS